MQVGKQILMKPSEVDESTQVTFKNGTSGTAPSGSHLTIFKIKGAAQAAKIAHA
jgi:hypothetical protein